MHAALYKTVLYCGIGLVTGTAARDCSVDVVHGFLPLRQAVTYGPLPVVPLYPLCASCGLIVTAPSSVIVGGSDYGFPGVGTGTGFPGWGYANGGSIIGNSVSDRNFATRNNGN